MECAPVNILTTDPHAIHPTIVALADHLPGLAEIETLLQDAGFRAEALICAGLLELIAYLVEGETLPDSPEHAAARMALKRMDDAGMA
jgi:hypothetical protein